MNYDERFQALSDEEKNDLHILEAELMASGGQKRLSNVDLGNLLSLSPTHANRRLETFTAHGLIEILKGKGRRKNLIIWKGNTSTKIIPLAGIVPLGCPLYVERAETKQCKQYLKASSYIKESLPFIRLKAAKGMGKSSELVRIHNFLETEQKQIVAFVDLGSNSFPPDIFNDLNALLYRFTEEVAERFSKSVSRLNPPNLEMSWKPHRSSGRNCTLYLEEHIFSKISQPKTLLIDGIDRVIGKDKTQLEFFNLLRTWNETKMKVVSKDRIVWPSIAIAYSTEPYLQYGFSVSPLQNVGKSVELQEFNPEEILELSKRYGLDWFSPKDVASLMALIGGHPTLINRALYKLSQEEINLSELALQATQLNGSFADYLLEYLKLLQKNAELSQCFKQIMEQGCCENEFAKCQLLKAGLIKLDNSGEKVGCELYRRYFRQHL